MSSRDEYLHKLQVTLEEWNTEIDKLTIKAGEVTAEVKNECNEQIEALKVKQATARQKIGELQHAGESAWQDLKSGIDLSLTAMREALDSVRTRFR